MLLGNYTQAKSCSMKMNQALSGYDSKSGKAQEHLQRDNSDIVMHTCHDQDEGSSLIHMRFRDARLCRRMQDRLVRATARYLVSTNVQSNDFKHDVQVAMSQE